MAAPLILADEQRLTLIHKGKRLQYFTISWNSLEAIVAIVQLGCGPERFRQFV